jgi:hypothetical protein
MGRTRRIAGVSLLIALAVAASSAGTARAGRGGHLFISSPSPGATVSGSIVWRASFTDTTPTRIDFLVDGVVKWSASASAPPFVYGSTGTFNTTTLANGKHKLGVTSYGGARGRLSSSSIRVVVANAASGTTPSAPPPPPAPSAIQVTAKPIDSSHAAISWQSVPGAESYSLSRDQQLIAQTQGNAFTDSLLWPATTYSYTVDALSTTGSVLASASPSATTDLLPATGYPRPFPADSVWNMPVGNAQPVANSASLISYFVAHANQPNMTLRAWGVSVAEAQPEQPVFSVPCLIYSNCTLSAFGPFHIPLTAVPDPQGDGHLAVYDPATRREWDMFQTQTTGNGWTAGGGAAVLTDGNGVAPAGTASGDAANFPLLGGLIRPEEVLQGHIDHALVFAMPGVSRLGHVCPATHNDGSSTDPNALREGMRVQLDPAVDADALQIPAWEKTVAHAMQTYGMYLRDEGGTLGVFAENPISRGYDAWAKVGFPSGNSIHLIGIPWDRFRVVSPPC